MMTGTHKISPEGVVTAPGIDYGLKPVRLIYRGKVLSVFRVPGFTTWVSRGKSGHAAALWALCVVRWPENMPDGQPSWAPSPVFEDASSLTMHGRTAGAVFDLVEVIEEHEPGLKWRACRDKLIRRAMTCIRPPLPR